MNRDLATKILHGSDLAPCLDDLARLRIEVFRDFPYLYDGTLDYEKRYLQTYVNAPDSVTILALDGDKIVGASTGLPMTHETEEFRQPFLAQGYDPEKIFYCGESVLLKSYRGRGFYKAFMEGRENHARKLGGLAHICFCAVERPQDHPLRPHDYVPLDAVWRKFGYAPQPHLRTEYVWKDIDTSHETAKPMQFWTKKLD